MLYLVDEKVQQLPHIGQIGPEYCTRHRGLALKVGHNIDAAPVDGHHLLLVVYGQVEQMVKAGGHGHQLLRVLQRGVQGDVEERLGELSDIFTGGRSQATAVRNNTLQGRGEDTYNKKKDIW